MINSTKVWFGAILGVILTAIVVYLFKANTPDAPPMSVDPALVAESAPEPRGLERLANRINQFTSLAAAVEVAAAEGYRCKVDERSIDPRLNPDPIIVFCPFRRADLSLNTKFLALKVAAANHFVRGLELRHTPLLPQYNGYGLSNTTVDAAGKGLDFDQTSKFADLIADRFGGAPERVCGPAEANPQHRRACEELRQQRAKQGLPARGREPLTTGSHVNVLHTLRSSLGFVCGDSAFVEQPAATDADIATVSCETRSFTGQAQKITLRTDAATTVPLELILDINGQVERLPLRGRSHADEAHAIAVLGRTTAGKEAVAKLSVRGADESIKDLDAPSRRRLASAAVKLIDSLYAEPNSEITTPALQRLDAAAYLLSLPAAEAATFASLDLRVVRADTAAAVALASCRANAEAADCLAPFVRAEPQVRTVLASAIEEVRRAHPGLGDDHPVQLRLARLARQLSSSGKRE